MREETQIDVKLSRHHRRPRSRRGGNHERNLIRVPETQHRAWHTLFGNKTPRQIACIINSVWIDPDFVVVVRKRR